MSYDIFICYASEDKPFVRRLAHELKERGLSVWYDEFSLRVGDSLRRKIDEGLYASRYGVVILSPNFLRKEWPKRELDGLTARETDSGSVVVLPIWHKINRETIASFSLPLADRLGVTTRLGVKRVADEIERRTRDLRLERFLSGNLEDGVVVRESSDDRRYVIFGQAKFWIPSPAEYDALGLKWSDTLEIPDGTLARIPRVPADGTQLTERSDDRVFLTYYTKKYHIRYAEWFDQQGLAWRVRVVPNRALEHLPYGGTEADIPPLT